MELFVNLGVSSTVELLQLPWDGTAAGGGQLLRKCVLGEKGIVCKRAWRCQLPGKAQTTAGSVFTSQQG